MSRGAQAFRQADVAKAIKATVSAGLSVERVEIDRDGKIIVVIGTPNLDAANDNEWDSVQLGAERTRLEFCQCGACELLSIELVQRWPY